MEMRSFKRSCEEESFTEVLPEGPEISGDLVKRPLIGSCLREVLRGDLVKSSCNRDIS